MVRTVLAILSTVLLSACGLKGPLYMTNEDGQLPASATMQQQQQNEASSDNLLRSTR